MANNSKILLLSLILILFILAWTLAYLVHSGFHFDLGGYFAYFKHNNFWVKRISLGIFLISELMLFYELIRLPEKYKWNSVLGFGIFMVFVGLVFSLAVLFGLFMSSGKSY